MTIADVIDQATGVDSWPAAFVAVAVIAAVAFLFWLLLR